MTNDADLHTSVVYLVWTESGEYENYSRDLRGVFATRDLAEQHRIAVKSSWEEPEDEVDEVEVLTVLPQRGRRYQRAAVVRPSGDVERKSDHPYNIWLHEYPECMGRIVKWSGERSPNPDLYVEVTGYDLEKVEAEFVRLLGEAKERLGV